MMFSLSESHPIFQTSEKVSVLCDSFLKAHGFNYFQYLRCYKNGTASALLNTTHLFKYFLESDFPIFSSYEEDHHKKSSYWFFWEEELPWLPVQIARQRGGLHHGITFVRRSSTYYDMIAFALPAPLPNAASYYMSKFHALEYFIQWFDINGKDLLNTGFQNPLHLPEIHRDPNYQDLCLTKNFRVCFQKEGKKERYLTAQELSCARLKLQGYSHKDIGRLLSLSPRTVETYLERLKVRLGISSHGDLIKMFSSCP